MIVMAPPPRRIVPGTLPRALGRWVTAFLLLAFATVLAAMPALAQSGTPAPRRLALVIGNQDYRHVPRLQNPVADARAMAGVLRERGFEVMEGIDLERGAMNRLFSRFEAALSTGTIAVLYFAGHGVQVGGANILLPVDIEARSEREALDDGIALPVLMERMAAANGRRGGGLNLLIIDACRDNPFQASGRSIGSTRGLAASGSSGVMVLYAAGTNQQALDRLGPQDRDPNGLFTRTLLREMRSPGLPVRELVGRVRNAVADAARAIGHDQIPAIYDEAVGDFVFTPASLTAPAAPPVSAPPSLPPQATDREALFWQSILNSRDSGDFEAYLRAFPDGVFAPLARSRLAALAPSVAPPSPPPAPPTGPSESDRLAARQGLVALGFHPGPASGAAFDDATTRAALRRFQRQMGLAEGTAPTDAEFAMLADAGGRLATLLDRPARSPRSVAAGAVSGAPARFDRGWAAEHAPGAGARELQEAAYWYALAARDGEARAFTQLGLLLARGQAGTARDPEGAVLLWRAAAARGDGTAMFNLGAAHEHGIGLAVERDAARRWYRLAAEARHPAAQAALDRLGR